MITTITSFFLRTLSLAASVYGYQSNGMTISSNLAFMELQPSAYKTQLIFEVYEVWRMSSEGYQQCDSS